MHGYGVPGIAAFIGVSMLVATAMMLMGPRTRGLALEDISH